MRFPYLLCILYFGTALIGEAASFDCKKARVPLDRIICSTPDLSTADSKLGIIYKMVISNQPIATAQKMQKDERVWLKSRAPWCSTRIGTQNLSIACLQDMYDDRISYLYGVYYQPAGTQQLVNLQYIYHVGSGGGNPSGVIADPLGDLYGAEESDGPSIFKLSPPSKQIEHWTMSTLFSFQRNYDEQSPISGLAIDRYGALYGTAGLRTRIVFKLTPPQDVGGNWTERTLAYFVSGGPDKVTLDPDGNIFATSDSSAPSIPGTTSFSSNSAGNIFELEPPAPGSVEWTAIVLHSFNGSPNDGAGPSAGLLRAADGSFYGTTAFGGIGTGCPTPFPNALQGCGTVFKLTPPAVANEDWRLDVIYSFNGAKNGAFPNSTLIMDAKGALYGWTLEGTCPAGIDQQRHYCGLVFKLTPPSQTESEWTETVLHRFAGPPDGENGLGGLDSLWGVAPLAMDKDGNLFGTTHSGGTNYNSSNGVVFELTPNLSPQGGWHERILYNFGETNGDGVYPASYGLLDVNGSYIGTTLLGGHEPGLGTIYKFTPQTSRGLASTK